MRIMWSADTTPTLKFWNPCYFVYKKGISLAFETMRNWISTAQILQPSQSMVKQPQSRDSFLKSAMDR